MPNITATQTGAVWDVDEDRGGAPVIARDGNGRPVGVVDPVTGFDVLGYSIVSAAVRCRISAGDAAVGSNNSANSGSRDGTHPSGPLYAGVASVLKGQLPALCGF